MEKQQLSRVAKAGSAVVLFGNHINQLFPLFDNQERQGKTRDTPTSKGAHRKVGTMSVRVSTQASFLSLESLPTFSLDKNTASTQALQLTSLLRDDDAGLPGRPTHQTAGSS